MICYPVPVPDTHELVRYIMFCVLVIMLNSFVTYIWLRPEGRSTITQWLVLIALSDSVAVLLMTLNTVAEFTKWRLTSTTLCPTLLIIKSLAIKSHSTSLLLATSMAIQRFLVCAFPLKGKEIFDVKIQRLFLIMSFILPMLCPLPNLVQLSSNIQAVSTVTSESYHLHGNITMESMNCAKHESLLKDYLLGTVLPSPKTPHMNESRQVLGCYRNTTETCPEPIQTNTTAISLDPTLCIGLSSFSDQSVKIIKICDLVIIHILPSLVITFCMAYCLHTIRKVRMRKYNITTRMMFKSHKKKIVLVAMVIISILSGEIPYIVYQGLEITYGSHREDIWLLTRSGRTFCELFTTASYLHNVMIYTAMSKQFRQSILNILCCRQTARNTSDSMNSNF